MSSAPAQLESINVINAVGCQPEYTIKTNDANKAYLQAYLDQPADVTTYVRLPRNRWPQSWVKKGYKDPVVPLILALYGHPDSGGHWEKHCVSVLTPLGWEAVNGWPSVFWHLKKKALLVVYVDDFALAGHAKDQDALW